MTASRICVRVISTPALRPIRSAMASATLFRCTPSMAMNSGTSLSAGAFHTRSNSSTSRKSTSMATSSPRISRTRDLRRVGAVTRSARRQRQRAGALQLCRELNGAVVLAVEFQIAQEKPVLGFLDRAVGVLHRNVLQRVAVPLLEQRLQVARRDHTLHLHVHGTAGGDGQQDAVAVAVIVRGVDGLAVVRDSLGPHGGNDRAVLEDFKGAPVVTDGAHVAVSTACRIS